MVIPPIRVISILEDLQTSLRAFFVFLFVFLFHRVLFWLTFSHQMLDDISWVEVIKAWWLGFRFDLRVILIFFLAFYMLFFVLRWVFKLTYKPERFLRPLQVGLMSLGLYGFLFTFWADFGNYAYLSERLSSKIFTQVTLFGFGTSWQMIWVSYPLLWIIFGFITVSTLLFLFISKFVFRGSEQSLIFFPHKRYYWTDMGIGLVCVLFMVFGIYSHTSRYSLRWGEAYFSRSNFVNQFALNPLHNVFDTYRFSGITYGDEDISEEIKQVKEDLGIPEAQGTLLRRTLKPQPLFATPPNVVIIMMESLASFQVGAYGAPLSVTPHLDKIISESLWFDNFYVNQMGTSSSIFCFITGIPDLSEEEMASRNPLIIDQHTMINNFKDYKKYYFIGGDANWANIGGILTNNIHHLNLMEGNSFGRETINVWGISDLELLEEAHETFKSQKNERFFAIIQTSSYHSPYVIPQRREGFEVLPLTDSQAKNYGFVDEGGYNALRFADHALGYFLKLAKSSDYYKDTLFVLYADHGNSFHNQAHLSSFYRQHGFPIYHIPLVFHSARLPSELKGKIDSRLGHEPDILPTIQSMVGIEGVNSSFGLDLLSEEALRRKGVFFKGSGGFPVKFFDGQRMIYTSFEKDSKIKSYKTKDFLKQLRVLGLDREFLNEEEEVSGEVRGLAELGRSYFKTIKFKTRNNQKSRVNQEPLGGP